MIDIRKVLMACLYVATAMSVSPQVLSPLLRDLPPELQHQLREEGRIMVTDDRPEFSLMPDAASARRIVEAFRELAPNISAESLVVIPRQLSRAEMLSLLNTFLRVSEYEEIQFFSERHQERLDVFYNSDRIDHPETRRVISDLQLTEIPASVSFYALQDFPPMGFAASVYEITFDHASGIMTFETMTLDSLSWGSVPLIAAENLKIQVVIIPTGSSTVIYGVGGVRAFGARILRNRVAPPFEGRVQGILEWVETNLREVVAQ